MSESEAGNLLNILASDRFAVMGEDGFGTLNSVFPPPKSSREAGNEMECVD